MKNPVAKKTNAPSSSSPATMETASTPIAKAGDNSPPPPYKSTVKGIFMFCNLGMMIFLAATGALGIQQSDSVNDTSVVFVGIYLILFAAIVFIYEIAQLCPDSSVDSFFKRNFGYLYGIIGKSLFIML